MRPTGLGLKLSARRRLPIILAYDGEYWPHSFLALVLRSLAWKRIEENPEYGIYKIGNQTIKLLRNPEKALNSPSYTRGFFAHCFQDWQRQYAPPHSPMTLRRNWLKGKTVLDVGSGVGETVFLFNRMGAERFICVDQNPKSCEVLRENAERNEWDATILCEPFSPKHMDLDWDYAKIDVEGGESCLLTLDRMPLKPIVMEVHSSKLVDSFINKFHFHIHEVLRRDDGKVAYAIMRYNPEGSL